MTEGYTVFLVGFLSAFMLASAIAVVRLRDLVYASTALAILGSLNAALVALLGFQLVAAFIVVVYVGAAVMFIIMSISMLGGGGTETREDYRGVLVSSALASGVIFALIVSGVIKSYTKPYSLDIAEVSSLLVSRYLPVLGLLFVALAATLVEAIAIARRGVTEE